MSLLKSSTRRPAPLTDIDYDHEIGLEDHTKRPPSPRPSRSLSATERPISNVLSDSSSRRHSDAPLRKDKSSERSERRLRRKYTKRKYRKYQDRGLGERADDGQPEASGGDMNTEILEAEEEDRGRTRVCTSPQRSKNHKEHDSAIDVLYENQRGGILCGIHLFSSKALGNLDPAPWTNIALKPSLTNPTNAQVPDPSWEWAWKDWRVNHSDEVDEDGWEYSFAFAKGFSWHGPKWWNSYVRRRAWIRKRVKIHCGYRVNQEHMLNEAYFTIHPAEMRSRSRGSTIGSHSKPYSVYSLARRDMEDDIVIEDIQDITSLMTALRFARIDREKTEAVESFIKHGGDDLCYLQDKMHDIMRMFIFQASRRSLLTHLLKIFNEASEQEKEITENGNEVDPVLKRRFENLEAAVKHADEEVKRLEFWSDVKHMAEKEHTKGAVDESQGWDKSWAGLDYSGPKDAISETKLPGTGDHKDGQGNGTAIVCGRENGKGKEKE